MRIQEDRDESGVSAIELVVAIAISALFLTMLSVLFITGLQAQERATSRDQATGGANVVSVTLNTSVRNAAEFRVSASGARLDAVVAVAGADTGDGAWDWEWQCRAWHLTGGALYYSEGTTARPTDIVTGRSPMVTGVAATPTGSAPFVQGTGSLEAQRGITIGLTVTTGDETVIIRDAVTAQVSIQGGAPACW
jgi:type II secretory pathway pseudopilin PulG